MKRLLLTCLIFGLLLAAIGAAVSAAVYMWAVQDLPNYKKVADYRPPLVTTVYARDGSIMGYFYNQRRFLVPLNSIPQHVINAFLASEDSSFYSHKGINPTAIVRAALSNLKSGEKTEGASTITQQLVKSLLLSKEKTYERKLKEAILSYRLESYLTKDEILTIYLNHIYLGNGAYGVEAAARTYFGKHVNELTLAEAAVLAGLPKAPTKLNPYSNPAEARGRQEYVLERLLTLGWITPEEHKAALSEVLTFKEMDELAARHGAWYMEEVRRELVDFLSEENMNRLGIKLERYGEDAVKESGLHVFTAMEPKHQAAAEVALRKNLENATRRHGWRGPLATLQPAEINAFLANNPLTQDFVEGNAWVKAVVTKVNKDGAEVRLGNAKGFIDLSTMSWCRKPNIKVFGPNAPAVKDPSSVVKENDVVYVSLREGQGFATPGSITAEDTLKLAIEQMPDLQSALVSIEADTGDVVALVGGYSFSSNNQFNRAIQARRQPGSAFKPIVYSAALDNGFTPASIVYDTPVVHFDQYSDTVWKPENFDSKFLGPIPLRTALAKSKNTCTVRVAQQIGIPAVIDRAYALGLDGKFQNVLSVSLGVVEITPLNLTEAYTAFARGGTRVKGRFITSIKDAWGQNLAVFPPETKEAISPQNAYLMDSMLKEVVQAGTGARARVLGKPMGGKTGTSNEERDAWFIGFTPYLVTGVYVGYDNPAPMGRMETGGVAALPAFVLYRQAVEAGYPPDDFKQPDGIVTSTVNGVTTPFVEGTVQNAIDSGYQGGSNATDVESEDLYKGLF